MNVAFFRYQISNSLFIKKITQKTGDKLALHQLEKILEKPLKAAPPEGWMKGAGVWRPSRSQTKQF